MILFLDTVTPNPKFFIFDNNKVIESLDILDKNDDKLSDVIQKKFNSLNNKHSLLKELDSLIVCTGPGSYTSLRVGISFMLGIHYIINIPIYGFSSTLLLSKFIPKNDFNNTFLIICSAKEQYFLCLPDEKEDSQYKSIKIENNNLLKKINLKKYTKCIYTHPLPDFLYNFVCSFIEKPYSVEFSNIIKKNLLNYKNNNEIIQPIYISNNEILN